VIFTLQDSPPSKSMGAEFLNWPKIDRSDVIQGGFLEEFPKDGGREDDRL